MERISVADVVRAVDEALDATQCRGRENCKDEACCLTHELWATLKLKMYEYLESVTLSDLVGKHRTKTGAGVSPLEDARHPKPRARGALSAPA
jgi:Rrf2 family iron-sulfur cluster assembly transcriptional regulator